MTDVALRTSLAAVALLAEAINKAFWKRVLQEDVEAIRSGHVIIRAKQELQEFEKYVNSASIIMARRDNNSEQLCDWISAAQDAVNCLEDEIAMHDIKPASERQIYYMKSAIGMLSFQKLTEILQDYKRNMPTEVHKSEIIMSQFSDAAPNSHPMPTEVFRMNSAYEQLMEFLRSDHPVIFITGAQGSGKTPLMKNAYDDDNVKNDFSVRSWVDTAKGSTSLVAFLRKVLEVEGSSAENDGISEMELMEAIRSTFQDKRYLVVLDDVQDTSPLHTLKLVLRGYKGKIICLTRREEIKEEPAVNITSLEPHDARKLLICAAFPGFIDIKGGGNAEFRAALKWRNDKNSSLDQAVSDLSPMIKILNDALHKCRGNPWNIWTLGVRLADNPFEKWNTVMERMDGVLIDDNIRTEKWDANLPPAMHHSFLYCLAFPERSGIPARKLLRLWMAEGFVQDSQEREAENLLKQLIEKKLLVVEKKGFDGDVLQCSISDHIRPWALKMCDLQKFCRFAHDFTRQTPPPSFPTFLNNIRQPRGTGKATMLPSRHRVLAVHGDGGVEEALRTLRKDVRLRSLLYFGTGMMPRSKFELSFKRTYRYSLLRTLELQGVLLDRLPHTIDCLVCLRYLGLRNTQLEDLPASLNRLKNLLCLDIRDTNITSLDGVSGFEKMRYLHLANSFLSQSVLISEGLRSLTNLQTLSGAAIGGNMEDELLYLTSLRKLSIKKASSDASSENICAAVNNIKSLRSLAISTSDGEQFDISSLKIGKDLRKLKLGGDLGVLCDSRLAMMHSLTYLYLWDSKLDVDVLHSLQSLRGLLLLSLCNASTCWKLSCTQGGYRKLKKLSIISMENLTECTFGTGAIRSLEELVFAKCDKLGSSPQGLEHILSLKHVYVAAMPRNFGETVKASAKDAQLHETKMYFHKSSRAATEERQTMAPEPTAPEATEDEGSQNKAVDPVSPPRGAQDNIQDTKSGDGNTSAVGSTAAPSKLMADAQKSYGHHRRPVLPSPSPASEKGKGPATEDIHDYSDDD